MFPPSLSRELNSSNDLKRSDPPDTYCQLSRRRRGFHQEGKELGLSNSMSARNFQIAAALELRIEMTLNIACDIIARVFLLTNVEHGRDTIIILMTLF